SAPEITREGSRWRLNPSSGGAVLIDQSLADGSRRSQTAQRAWISVGADESASPATFTLELEEIGSLGDVGPRRQRLVMEQLRLDTDPGAELFELPVHDLLAEADRAINAARDDPEIASLRTPRAALEARVAKLGREIIGNHNERSALAAACFIMTLCGAIIA